MSLIKTLKTTITPTMFIGLYSKGLLANLELSGTGPQDLQLQFIITTNTGSISLSLSVFSISRNK